MIKVNDKMNNTVYGIGHFGYGKYIKGEKSYSRWSNMLKRCYSKEFHKENKSYIGCYVCDEWLNYQNFAKWFYDNYVEEYHLDKDLKIYGNKLYSPDTCIFVPRSINNFFWKKKYKELPNGVVKAGVGYSSSIKYKIRYLINDAMNDYWNDKHHATKMLIDKNYKFKMIIENYFENYFNEYYSTGE